MKLLGASPSRRAAFTLVEIALSLAIIGFALVAIIGVLPRGLKVQQENREETIIVQDANYFIDAIRGGARGLNDLTNYVEAITNYTTDIANRVVVNQHTYGYTYQGTSFDGSSGVASEVLTNGANIIGLLSTPKFIFADNKPFPPNPQLTDYRSNYIVAYVRALSGPAIDKAPQTNTLVQDLAFRYRLVSEVVPSSDWNTNWVDFNLPGLATNEIILRSNAWNVARTRQANQQEVRLLFRWPVSAQRTVSPSANRQVFRTMIGGSFTNEANSPRWFLQNATYQAIQ